MPLAQDLSCQEEFTTPGTEQQDLLSPGHTRQQSMGISTATPLRKGSSLLKSHSSNTAMLQEAPFKHLPGVGKELLYPV